MLRRNLLIVSLALVGLCNLPALRGADKPPQVGIRLRILN